MNELILAIILPILLIGSCFIAYLIGEQLKEELQN